MTTAVTYSDYVAGTTPATRTPSTKLDSNDFMSLLVAQLRYQNPMSPADPQSFLAQTAQFTSVEKLQELTTLLTSSEHLSQLSTGASLIGRQVSYALSNGTTVRGTVTAAKPTADGAVVTVDKTDVALTSVVSVF